MRNHKTIKKGALLLALLFSGQQIFAQTTDALSSYTPYSIYGVGDVAMQGTAFNKGMGGIGIGVRDSRSINYLNPAAISQRDTLSFMMDFGLEQKNFYLKNNNTKTAYNAFNMNHLILTMPLYRNLSFVVGATPYSNVGYKMEKTETDPVLVSEIGDIKYQKYGTGGITQLFLGASAKLSRHLSVGAEGIYYFGTIDRYSNILFKSNSSYRTINTGYDYVLSSFSGKLGLQYSAKVGKDMNLTVGATYLIKSKLDGDFSKYNYAIGSTGAVDTVSYVTTSDTKMEIPTEIGFGFSLRKMDKWMVGADYTRQDWTKTTFDATPGVNFSTAASNSYKVGFEYVPSRYDVRYYLKRVTYKGGLHYDQSYIKMNGKQINTEGVTVGINLPISRGYNAVGLSVDMGQRGSLKHDMVKEKYFMFIINISIHDNTWFRKVKYD